MYRIDEDHAEEALETVLPQRKSPFRGVRSSDTPDCPDGAFLIWDTDSSICFSAGHDFVQTDGMHVIGGREYYEKLPLPDIGLTKSLSAILFVILSVPFGKQQLRCFRVRYITAKPGPTPPSSHPTSSKAPTHSRIDETLLRRSLRLRKVHISSAFLA